jgi:hypothetical protein
VADYSDARRIAVALPEVEEVFVAEWGRSDRKDSSDRSDRSDRKDSSDRKDR